MGFHTRALACGMSCTVDSLQLQLRLQLQWSVTINQVLKHDT